MAMIVELLTEKLLWLLCNRKIANQILCVCVWKKLKESKTDHLMVTILL